MNDIVKKAVFLDRDGVINEVLSRRVKFVNKPEQFYLLEGVGEAVKRLNDLNFLVFVVTNQGGVGLGFMREEMLQNVHEKMKDDLLKYGAHVDGVAYCIHKPKEGCECRKPGSKMLENFIEKYNVDISQSYMIGDRDVDIQAGKKAGLQTVLVGKEKYEEADEHFKDLREAVLWIEKN